MQEAHARRASIAIKLDRAQLEKEEAERRAEAAKNVEAIAESNQEGSEDSDKSEEGKGISQAELDLIRSEEQARA